MGQTDTAVSGERHTRDTFHNRLSWSYAGVGPPCPELDERKGHPAADGDLQHAADGIALAPVALEIDMTSEQLTRLEQNPFYVQAHEFFVEASQTLSEMLEEMAWSPSTPEQRDAIRLQCERTKQARLVLQQLRELVLSAQKRPSRRAESRGRRPRRCA